MRIGVRQLVPPHADLRRVRRSPRQRFSRLRCCSARRSCCGLRAEWRRDAPCAAAALVALAVSFCVVASLFGTRLSGHHFMVLLPIAYAALAVGLVAHVDALPAWRSATTTLVAALRRARGAQRRRPGQGSAQALRDARRRTLFRRDQPARRRRSTPRRKRPFVYFPDWGLLMPVAILTGGRVGVDSLENYAAARKGCVTAATSRSR